jgi:hypothetical protein
MAFIQLNPIAADPGAIQSGDSVILSYTVSGDDGVPLEITYSIYDNNNIYFVLEDGSNSKILPVDTPVLTNPPMAIEKTVRICKILAPPGPDYGAFDINVHVKDTSGLTTDLKHCNITIA